MNQGIDGDHMAASFEPAGPRFWRRHQDLGECHRQYLIGYPENLSHRNDEGLLQQLPGTLVRRIHARKLVIDPFGQVSSSDVPDKEIEAIG